MNNTSLFEYIALGLVLLIQTLTGVRVWIKIKHYKKLIPSLSFFHMERYAIPLKDLIAFGPKRILEKLPSYPKLAKNEDAPSFDDFKTIEAIKKGTVIEISLIKTFTTFSSVFQTIIEAINVYLLKNKGANSDFNLMQDITERNTDAVDEDINQLVTVPLYLGLIGTIVGIIFGLSELFTLSTATDEINVKPFLKGVAIAMSASGYGLLWTVVNSNFRYKKAKTTVEKGKNTFYTFIQTELLPILNQSVFSSVQTLNTNLLKFNEGFTTNIDRLSGLLTKNYEAVEAQDRILQNLENIDITTFAKANVSILGELKTGTETLRNFSAGINSLNKSVEGTKLLSESLNALLNRTNNFEELAIKLDRRVEESNQLIDFFNSHFDVLTSSGRLITESVKKVDGMLSQSLDELNEHTNDKILNLKENNQKDLSLLERAYSDKESHLAKLDLLQDIKEGFELLQSSFQEGIEKNTRSLAGLSDSLSGNTELTTKENQEVTKLLNKLDQSLHLINTTLSIKNEPNSEVNKSLNALPSLVKQELAAINQANTDKTLELFQKMDDTMAQLTESLKSGGGDNRKYKDDLKYFFDDIAERLYNLSRAEKSIEIEKKAKKKKEEKSKNMQRLKDEVKKIFQK